MHSCRLYFEYCVWYFLFLGIDFKLPVVLILYQLLGMMLFPQIMTTSEVIKLLMFSKLATFVTNSFPNFQKNLAAHSYIVT